MSDTGITITPEDRERLAKSKFGEWFDEFFEKKFEEAFEKKQGSRRTPTNAPQSSPEPGQSAPTSPQTPARRRSLLEACLTDTFGF